MFKIGTDSDQANIREEYYEHNQAAPHWVNGCDAQRDVERQHQSG